MKRWPMCMYQGMLARRTKIIHNLISPKYFMPVHGEYRHLNMQT